MKKFTLLFCCALMFVAFSCKKKPVNPDPEPYTTFTLNGVQKKFTHHTKFSKDFCSSSTFCCSFSSSSESNAESIKFGIPGDPIVGHVYQTGERRFSCYYFSSAGIRYDQTWGASYQVIFSVWQGQGGWGQGTYSGVLKSSEGDSVIIDNGYFQNMIWTSGSK
jgi:hypothetical protein